MGRWAVMVAGGLGISALVGYGLLDGKNGAADSSALEQARAEPESRAAFEVERLLTQARAARLALDVTTLTELTDSLRKAASGAASAERRTVELELADVLATRALEATIRSHAVQTGRSEAERLASDTITAVAPMLDALEASSADPARVRAIRARVALAAGDDVLESYPAVLLPTFHDEELRLAAMAGPVWRDPEVSADLVGEVVTALREAQRDTGLIQALLALSLQVQGERESALEIVDAILKRVPSQPTARALRAELMASPQPAAVAMVGATASTQTAPALEPEPEPEPEPSAPQAQETPAHAEPTPEPKTEPPAPKPRSTASTKTERPEKPAKSSNSYDALVSEGCKKVQSGDAAAGFELLTKAFDLQPGALQVTVCMAEAHHKLGRAPSARAMAERALGKSPNNKRALALMATLEAERGNRPGAEKYYRKLLDVDPNNAKAKAYLDAG